MKHRLKINSMVTERVFNTPLMLEREKAAAIGNYIKSRITGDAAEYSPTPSSHNQIDQHEMKLDNVAVIGVTGTLVHRGGFADAESGLQSYQSLRTELVAAANNDAIKVIVMDIDSCGGEVDGNFELARLVRQINDEYKPVVAIANGKAFSAAYSIACAAGSFFMIETGCVGSVGVCTQHIDFSKANEMAGVVITDITAGEGKADFSENHPLTPEAKQVLQAKIDNTYSIFVNHVSEMRGIDQAQIKNIGAALIFGENAVTLKFVDGIIAFDHLIEGLVNMDFPVDLTTRQERIMNMAFLNKKEKANADKPVEGEDKDKGEPVGIPDPAIPAVEPEKDTSDEVEDKNEVDDPVERAAGISEVCAKSGFSEHAAKYIRSNMTLAQVKAEVENNNQIKLACKLAGKPDKAESFIKSGKSLANVQKELVAEMESGQSTTDISNKVDPAKAKEQVEQGKNWLLEDAELRQKAAQSNKGDHK